MQRLTVLVTSVAIAVAACGTAGGDQADELPPDTPVDGGSAAGACLVGTPDCNDTPGIGPGEPGSGLVADGGLTVPEALVTDAVGPLAVQGFLVADSSGIRLCEVLAESFPPQCGGESVVVDGLVALEEYVTASEGGVSWSDTSVLLFGEIIDGVFVVDAGMNG